MTLKKLNFKWSGITLEGRKVEGETEAFSLNLAKFNLREQNIFVIQIRKKRKNLLTRSAKKISHADISIFYRQLATLITAGIPLVQGCDILLQSQKHPQLAKLIQTIKSELENGKALSTALRKHPVEFDTLSCHLVEIAELSGTLDIMLKRIADHKENSRALKNKIKQALFYPAIITIVAILVTVTMLLVVIPRFAELFQNFHSQLPWLTLQVIRLADFIRQHWWLGLLPFSGIFILWYFYKKSFRLKAALDHSLLKIPIIGELIQKFILARYGRTLATQLGAGIPITQALIMMVNTSNNHIFKTATKKLQLEISAGQSLNKAMLNTQAFPSLMTQMVKVGEESGSLEFMLGKAAEFYEAEIDYWIGNFSHLLEPLIIIILGVLIGGLVIAMYLPIFKLGTVL
jgi:type IV pilus assembly protein PilC